MPNSSWFQFAGSLCGTALWADFCLGPSVIGLDKSMMAWWACEEWAVLSDPEEPSVLPSIERDESSCDEEDTPWLLRRFTTSPDNKKIRERVKLPLILAKARGVPFARGRLIMVSWVSAGEPVATWGGACPLVGDLLLFSLSMQVRLVVSGPTLASFGMTAGSGDISTYSTSTSLFTRRNSPDRVVETRFRLGISVDGASIFDEAKLRKHYASILDNKLTEWLERCSGKL